MFASNIQRAALLFPFCVNGASLQQNSIAVADVGVPSRPRLIYLAIGST